MKEYKKITVNLDKRSYPIFLGNNILEKKVREVLRNGKNKIVIVIDSNVKNMQGKTIDKAFKKYEKNLKIIVLPFGEKVKSFKFLEKILEKALSFKIDRNIFLFAIGGGVIGDLAGLASSLLLRGINLIQVPTSLLAQVDSSVGGKTGINSKYGKNLIGTFKQPKSVIISIDFLKTLKKREIISGYAEILKYSLIRDQKFFIWLLKNGNSILNLDEQSCLYAISKSCNIKAKIVSQDENEKGIREILNLGHTFGHAIESSQGYSDKINHGEAIFIGMVMALEFSVYLKLCKKIVLEKLINHLEDLSISYRMLDYKLNIDTKNFIKYLKFDKKIKNNKLKFILLKDIGVPFSYILEDESILTDFLNTRLI